MGLFSRKEKSVEKKGELPSLPELPKFPSLSGKEETEGELPKLPSFPKSPVGEKLSEDTIKKAINGKKEEAREIFEDEFAEEEQMILESPEKKQGFIAPQKSFRKEISEDFQEEKRAFPNYAPQRRTFERQIPEGFEDANRKLIESEPIFVRMDKFEETKKIFKKTKEQLSEIEKVLERVKSVQQEEDKELASWEKEILNIKDKINTVERDIFSKA